MTTPRDIDASLLPETTFGTANLSWWGTTSFMVSEAVTLIVAMVSVFYLRRGSGQWPPAPIPVPGLLAASLNAGLLLLLLVPMTIAGRAARQLDLRTVRIALVSSTLMGIGAVALRGFELSALHVNWDDGVYGSVQWFTLGFHGFLLFIDMFESGIMALFTWIAPDKLSLMTDVEDAMLYQWFLGLMNLPVFGVVFLLPRVG